MQTKTDRTPERLNHPDREEWMAFLYDEVAPERKRELDFHATNCPSCAIQLKQWREAMTALDDWKLRPMRRANLWRRPAAALKWAAATVLLLGLGYVSGKATSNKELASLQASVARLTVKVERQSDRDTDIEAARLLSDYAKLNEAQRAEDQRAVAIALRTLDLKLSTLRSELETVAVNTESSFQQTQDGLSRLALAAAEESKPSH